MGLCHSYHKEEIAEIPEVIYTAEYVRNECVMKQKERLKKFLEDVLANIKAKDYKWNGCYFDEPIYPENLKYLNILGFSVEVEEVENSCSKHINYTTLVKWGWDSPPNAEETVIEATEVKIRAIVRG